MSMGRALSMCSLVCGRGHGLAEAEEFTTKHTKGTKAGFARNKTIDSRTNLARFAPPWRLSALALNLTKAPAPLCPPCAPW